MIDKTCLPVELHGVHDYLTEENFEAKIRNCKLLNKMYLGLVRCGVEEEIFDCINIVLELYYFFERKYQVHKLHSIYRRFAGDYDCRKNDIFAVLYYILRRTNKDSLLLEIIVSTFERNFPFGGTSLDMFKKMIEAEEQEHEEFLRNQDAIFELYGQWQEDDWSDSIADFEHIISEYTFGRTEYKKDLLAKEAMDERNKELEEYYNSPEGQTELNALADDPTFEEIENAPCVPEDEILVWDNEGLKSVKKENIVISQSSADTSKDFIHFTNKATQIHVDMLRKACQHRNAASEVLKLLAEWEGEFTILNMKDKATIYKDLCTFCKQHGIKHFVLEKSFNDAYTKKLCEDREKYCRLF